jgi:hypothetical protein
MKVLQPVPMDNNANSRQTGRFIEKERITRRVRTERKTRRKNDGGHREIKSVEPTFSRESLQSKKESRRDEEMKTLHNDLKLKTT